jgi:hypothetical protein
LKLAGGVRMHSRGKGRRWRRQQRHSDALAAALTAEQTAAVAARRVLDGGRTHVTVGIILATNAFFMSRRFPFHVGFV